jgi:hypothetical protein
VPQDRFALIIGSDEYSDQGLRRLAAPSNDVDALATALKDPEIGGFEVAVAVNEPSHQVRRRIEAFFRDRRRDDLLLLYFSGHGLKDELGRLFLAMTDTERHLLQATAVPAGFVQDAIEQTRSRRTVLLLDCCYGGAFAHGMSSKGDAAVHVNDGFGATGSVVLTSSNELEYAFEEDGLSGSASASVFTRFLVEGLSSGQADGNGDGYIDLDELYGYVHDRVIEQRPDQRPMRWNYGVQGRITLARNPHWELPQLIRDEMDSPISASRVAAVRQLAQLCQVGSDLVRSRARKALEQLVDDDSKQVCQAAREALARLQPVSAAMSLAPVVVAADELTAEKVPSPVPVEEPNPPPPPVGEPDPPPAATVRPPDDVVVPRPRPAPSVPAQEGGGAVTARPPDDRPAAGNDGQAAPADDAPPQRPRRRMRSRLGLAIALAIVLVVSAVGTALARFASSHGAAVSQTAAQLPVPVVAASGVDAVKALRAAGFDVQTMKVTHPHVAKGQVIKTDPPAGTRVPPHSVVTVTISDGLGLLKVPRVSRKAKFATRTLTAAGLGVEPHKEPSDTIREGQVTRTEPKVGSLVSAGTVVKMYISKGKPTTTTSPAVRPSPTRSPTRSPTSLPSPAPSPAPSPSSSPAPSGT